MLGPRHTHTHTPALTAGNLSQPAASSSPGTGGPEWLCVGNSGNPGPTPASWDSAPHCHHFFSKQKHASCLTGQSDRCPWENEINAASRLRPCKERGNVWARTGGKAVNEGSGPGGQQLPASKPGGFEVGEISERECAEEGGVLTAAARHNAAAREEMEGEEPSEAAARALA